jgi:hypothetical protein
LTSYFGGKLLNYNEAIFISFFNLVALNIT